MRVVHLTSLHAPDDVRIFVKECRTLAAAGHEVHLVAPAAALELRDGVRLHPLTGAVAEPGVRKLAGRLSAAWRSARALRADVYHLHEPELIPLAVLLRAAGNRVVYDAHEETPLEVRALHRSAAVGGLLALAWRAAERVCGAAAHGIVAATPSIARRFPERKTVVARNYPAADEAERFRGPPHEGRPHDVVYLGGVSAIRGAREIVAAIERVRDPDARLVIAGVMQPAALRSELEREAGWARVDFRGWLSREGVAATLRDARIGLLTLHPVAAHLESLPVKLFEYMAAGVPVVASDFPLWRQIVGGSGCGVLVDPLDAGAIAAAVDGLLGDPAAAAELGARGRTAFAERYSWRTEAAELLALYGRLAAA